MTRRDLLKSSVAAAAPLAGRKPPNFLFIISDQLNLDALSAHGNPWARTPNLDRLVKRGVTFMESHSANPVCSPARSAMMTGRMPVETGVTVNSKPIEAGMPNMGQWFRQNGYDAAYSGKWHLPGAVRAGDGFDALPALGSGQGAVMDPWVSLSCDSYIRNHTAAKPFVLVASLLNPHDICFWSIQHKELVPPDLPFPGMADKFPPLPPNHKVRPKEPRALETAWFKFFSDEQWRYYLYCYYRQVEMMDAEVGRMLRAVEESGHGEDTIVIFTSDHGEGAGRHMHVQKWYPYDEAVKVPLMVSCPGRMEQGLRDTAHLVSGIDILSTMCDYAGIPTPPNARGRSLRRLLENKNGESREFVTSEVRITGRMIRTSDYKYVRFKDDPVEQLFNMKADPWETKNLYEEAKYGDVLREHRKLLDGWMGIAFDSRMRLQEGRPGSFSAAAKPSDQGVARGRGRPPHKKWPNSRRLRTRADHEKRWSAARCDGFKKNLAALDII